MTLTRIGIAAVGVLFGVIAYHLQVEELHSSSAEAGATVAYSWAFLVAGLAAWSRRPANRVGPLMVAAGLALLVRQFRYSDDPLVFTVFFGIGELPYALIAHAALAYPSGRVRDRVEYRFLQVVYASVLAFPLAVLLAYDGSRPLRFMPGPRESLLVVGGGDSVLAERIWQVFVVFAYGVLASTFIVLIARKLVLATPRGRRLLAPLLIAAMVAGLRAVWEGVVTFVTPPPVSILDNLFWWQAAALLALPLALLAGLLHARLAHADIGDLVLRLERALPQDLRDELARALDDPTLELALWLPERRGYADAAGRPVSLPDEGPRRAITKLDQNGEPLAALIHDPSLRDDPELVEAAGAAARLALVNARLHAEVQAQLGKVKESRARIVEAADEERRRIERDLHDGAQQRLVALALELRSAQRQAGPEVEGLLAEAVTELQTAVSELRELARGIHPAILTEGGLRAALEALALRSPVPVRVDSNLEGRLTPNVEATAYFLASEALTNVVKHAQARRASVSARRGNGMLVVAVEDDGVGGAAVDGGSGLRGLVDRVEAQGGRLRIESPAGGGTRVVGEIPCA